jgi:hypothetical protein
MKLLLRIFILITLPIFCFAQTDSIPMIAYWSKGDTRSFKVSKSKIQYKDGKMVKDERASHSSAVIVLDSLKDSYLLEWKCENNILTGKPLPKELGAIAEKYRYLTIKYKTDDAGTFEGISNIEEVTAMIQDLFKMISDNMKPEQVQVFKSLKSIYDSPDAISGILTKELQLIHWPMGGVYSTTDTLEYDEQLPNFLGGDPIKGKGKIVVDSVNAEAGLCYMTNTLNISESDSKKAATDMLTKITGAMKFASAAEKEKKTTEMKSFFDKMSMDISDRNVFIYDYINGWPIRITSSRKIIMNSAEGKMDQTESTEIEQIK